MKKLTGIIVAQNNLKTVAVNVTHYKKHPKYKKVIKSSRKIQVHHENLDLRVGQVVVIKQSRPFSATKRFCIVDAKPEGKEQ